jgi:hypothetical protein
VSAGLLIRIPNHWGFEKTASATTAAPHSHDNASRARTGRRTPAHDGQQLCYQHAQLHHISNANALRELG